MSIQEFCFDSIEYKNINKLLLKCIDLRKHIELANVDSLQRFHDQETILRHKLLERYYQLRKQQKDAYVKIELYIEKSSQPCEDPIYFLCNPNWTIYTAKHEIIQQARLDASPSNVLVVCQNKIANDWSNLKDCGIEKDGDMLYVYIAQCNITVETVKNESNSSDETSFTGLMKQFSLFSSQQSKSPVELTEVEHESTNTSKSKFKEANESSFINEPAMQMSPEFSTASTSGIHKSSSSKIEISVSETTPSSNIIKFFGTADVENSTSTTNTLVEFKVGENILSQSEIIPKTLPAQVLKKFDALQNSFGWTCMKCTYVNQPTRPGCEMCSSPRPNDYRLPTDYVLTADEQELIKKQQRSDELFKKLQMSEEENRKQNYQNYLSAHQQSLLENSEAIECSICMSDAGPGEAVKLTECFHTFCKECLSMHINMSDQLPVKCPYVDDDNNCSALILDREIRSLLQKDQYQSYLRKSLSDAEKHVKNSYHCKTPDCHGWCEFDDGVNTFRCPVCDRVNCLTCKAIHDSMNCREYQNQLFNENSNKHAKKTRKFLKKLVKKKEAMHCPACNIILMKKEGCDWLQCTMCHLEICWVTQQPRWGPGGHGDISGGCHCRENGVKCHPKCVNCH